MTAMKVSGLRLPGALSPSCGPVIPASMSLGFRPKGSASFERAELNRSERIYAVTHRNVVAPMSYPSNLASFLVGLIEVGAGQPADILPEIDIPVDF